MADKAAENIKTVTVKGVDVDIDLGYARSWAGIRAAARTGSSELNEGGRFQALLDYYDRIVANMDEIDEKMRDAEGSEVIALLGEAVRKATPKN